MKQYLLLVLLAQFILVPCFGQSFSFHSESPFGIQTVRGDSTAATQKIMFTDYDLDGDQDIFHTGLDYLDKGDPITWDLIHYFIEYQENTGDKWNPQFAERMNIFVDFPFPLGYFFPTNGDLNNDGKTDFIVSSIVDFIGNRTSTYLRNTGAAGADQFEVTRLDAMGLNDFVPESFFIPELIDLDKDGDLDLLMSGFDSAIAEEDGPDVPVYYYAKNVGTPNAPDLLGWYDNPYGLMPDTIGEILTSGDIDNDGDVDCIGAMLFLPKDSLTYLLVHINTPGGNGKPAFTSPLRSPFGLPSLSGENQFAFPELVDIDADGDLDLFIFLVDTNGLVLQYYENNLCTEVTTEMEVNLCDGDAFSLGGEIFTDAGEYTVNFVGSNGCDSIVFLTITIIPPTNVFLEQTICNGESVTIGNETFSASGNYTIFIQGADGCDSIVDLALTVHEVDIAVVSDENTLTADLSGASYQWFDCNSGNDIPGATQQSFTATVTGNFAVRITDQFGCTAVSACISVVVTGLEQDLVSAGVNIYPNPGHGIFYIKNKTSITATRITISDLSGQQIVELIPDENKSVDISILKPGVYIVKIRMNEFDVVKKLVVMN